MVECVFSGCDFKTNVYGTFVTHKSRKHNPRSSNDFKAEYPKISMSEETRQFFWLLWLADEPKVQDGRL